MIKYIFLFLITNTAMSVPLPVRASDVINKDQKVILESTELIIKWESFTPIWKNGLGHKERIIGHGDYVCKKRYKNIKKIDEKQAKQCVIEVVNYIYKDVKAKLPNLKPDQYVAIISLIFNVGYDSFYNSRLFNLIKKHPNRINMIKYEWKDFSHVNHIFCEGLLNRRKDELKKYFSQNA